MNRILAVHPVMGMTGLLAVSMHLAGVSYATDIPAANDTPAAAPASMITSAYCGLYCAYSSARIMGVDAEFSSILDSKYLSGKYGSTADDLIAALKHYGIGGRQVSAYTVDRLRNARHPVILHVRPPGTGKLYRHWVLFLGMEGDSVRIYDPPREHLVISSAELLAIWDNVAIEVLEPPSSAISSSLRIPETSTLTVVVIAILAVWVGVRYSPPAFAVIVAIVVTAVSAHAINPSGFCWNRTAVANVIATHFRENISIIDRTQMKELIQQGNVTLVDARSIRAYERGHIPDAVNCPIDSGYGNIVATARAAGSAKSVIVYCQNEKCDWADRVATQLKTRGVAHVSVYRGGLADWQSVQE